MARTVIGTRIREHRRHSGMTQAELARRAGISASYMNLIEHNRRAVAGALLHRLAGALSLRPEELDGAAEQRLLEVLDEIAHDPELADLGIETDAVGDLTARYPGWSRALSTLARTGREASSAARALADRLGHDPFLAEAIHRMLTRIAAIRSAAAIIGDVPDLPAERRTRFEGMIREEARALSDVGESLAEYFDRAAEPRRALTPLDEVEALFDAGRNWFPRIETAAAALSERVLAERAMPGGRQARELAERELGPELDAILDNAAEIETTQGRIRARRALLDHAGAAIRLPMPVFAPRAAALRYDAEALAGHFAVGAGAVCLRLASLPGSGPGSGPGPEHPRFGYFRANAAGTIVERRGLPGLVAPRHAPPCPLWALYRALSTPGVAICQRADFPSGKRFVFIARARAIGPAAFGQPQNHVTDMLALSESDARATVYAPGPAIPTEPVGPACRICPRTACRHRVEDAIAG